MSKNKMGRVELHPGTIKYIKKGHPWVTLDRFSATFPKENLFLLGLDAKGKEVALLLNDHQHKNIKARVWSTQPPFNQRVHHFPLETREKIRQALKKRELAKVFEERENFYIVFGEADFLPGLFIQVFGQHVLVQYYAYFWKKLETKLIDALKLELPAFFPEKKFFFWTQKRLSSQKDQIQALDRNAPKEFVVNEFGVSYKIKMREGYDKGLYTDMSAIRKKILPYLEDSNTVLNLYSYTGAFSLAAINSGAKDVVSVDLSPKYMDWLEENISLNTQFKDGEHTSFVCSVDEAVSKLIEEKKTFDFIVCDPPSASSDGKKVTQAFKSYEKLLPKLLKLGEKGGHILVFLNTHTISPKKFEQQIQDILNNSKSPLKTEIKARYKLNEDCPTLPGFQEGNYLKGLLVSLS